MIPFRARMEKWVKVFVIWCIVEMSTEGAT